MRVVALAPGLASCEINLVDAQEPPDILDVDIAKFPGQQGPGPAREPGRRRLIEQLQNPLVGRLRMSVFRAGMPRLQTSFGYSSVAEGRRAAVRICGGVAGSQGRVRGWSAGA